jgi:peptide/nickel transport system ATP-binding protein
MDPILSVKNLSLHYLTRFNEKVQAVDGVSFDLQRGQILGVAGESGCGKSTLVNGCMGIYNPPLYHSSGDLLLEGKSLAGMSVEANRRNILGKQISLIPQGALNSLNPTRKIKDLALDLIESHDDITDKKEVYERLRERFTKIGLKADQVLNSYSVQIPAGMKQRVVIGLSTLLNPKVVLADEPTSALDVSTQKSLIRLLFDLIDTGIFDSMIFITHELPLLRHVADYIAVMYAGEFVEIGTIDQVIYDPRMPYTQALMGAMLVVDPEQKRRPPMRIEGAPPNLKFPIKGCRFADRCFMAREDCHTTRQELIMAGGRPVRCMYAKRD